MSKNYVGKAKLGKFGILNASFKLEDLRKIVNDKGYVNVSISEMKQADKYGYTHTIYENDYKPQAKEEIAQESQNLPF